MSAHLTPALPPPEGRGNGFCVWFTGLSGSGKTSTALELRAMLENRGRVVTLLDGDVVRENLSLGLGFSREDRDINIRRIGFVANEIVRHGGAVICAAISPYEQTREFVRNLIGNSFVEVFVNTPLAICEHRDVKGLYAKARRGELKAFTGVDDPYEPPVSPELILETERTGVRANAQKIIEYLEITGFLAYNAKITSRGYCE